ncbi:hypothetical protein RHSIM_Rhsim09G0211500 [Rhododendron simsii]|uniref:Uncharacterized protein n=1 Tax=Rhododendron simsii TaxID=118357 RepID=A0A834GF66_RHOSS|nr:hypothetical protein RHSIM_Rhsim09G0211500 [Rhododendron simsii]
MRYYCVVVATTTNLPWPWHHPPLLQYSSHSQSQRLLQRPHQRQNSTIPRAFFSRTDFDGFAKRAASGELWRDAWRSANDGFDQLLFETKKTAERIDREYSVSRRLSAVAESAAGRARELDRDFEVTQRWRTFTLDFSRNWPKILVKISYPSSALLLDIVLMREYEYRKQLNNFLDSPLGRIFATIFFLWFALSGWMFRFFIFAVWILPFAGPLLIGRIANNFVIKALVTLTASNRLTVASAQNYRGSESFHFGLEPGACPACKKQFVGYKNQVVRCTGCRNIVWQPQGDFFSRGSSGNTRRKSDPDIIDVEFEEK